MNKKAIALARKLRELYERGEEGERENAAAKLTALLEKHGLTMEDIEDDVKEDRSFAVGLKEADIFVIVMTNVLGSAALGELWVVKEDPDTWHITLNKSDYIEIEAKYEFFKAAWHKEYIRSLQAFVYRQDLYSKDAKTAEEVDQKEAMEVALRAQRMRKYHFRTQLGGLAGELGE